MTPRYLMSVGAVCGLFAAVLSIVAEPTGSTVVVVWAAGALFGKGYGVWEERSKSRSGDT